jgi:hypothetical protein
MLCCPAHPGTLKIGPPMTSVPGSAQFPSTLSLFLLHSPSPPKSAASKSIDQHLVPVLGSEWHTGIFEPNLTSQLISLEQFKKLNCHWKIMRYRGVKRAGWRPHRLEEYLLPCRGWSSPTTYRQCHSSCVLWWRICSLAALSKMVAVSHMGQSNTQNVASETEELNWKV